MSDLKLGYLKRMFNNLFLSIWHTEVLSDDYFHEKNVKRYNTDLLKVWRFKKISMLETVVQLWELLGKLTL